MNPQPTTTSPRRHSSLCSRFCRATARFIRRDDGPTAVEYAVLLALIVVACIATVQAMSNATAASFDNTATQISNAFGS